MKDQMIKKIAEIDTNVATNYPVSDAVAKSSVGFGSAFAAMSINDWVGLAVGLASLVYMLLNIEQALKRREDLKKKEMLK